MGLGVMHEPLCRRKYYANLHDCSCSHVIQKFILHPFTMEAGCDIVTMTDVPSIYNIRTDEQILYDMEV